LLHNLVSAAAWPWTRNYVYRLGWASVEIYMNICVLSLHAWDNSTCYIHYLGMCYWRNI